MCVSNCCLNLRCSFINYKSIYSNWLYSYDCYNNNILTILVSGLLQVYAHIYYIKQLGMINWDSEMRIIKGFEIALMLHQFE